MGLVKVLVDAAVRVYESARNKRRKRREALIAAKKRAERNAAHRAWYAANKEAIKKKAAIYRKENRAECRAAFYRHYHASPRRYINLQNERVRLKQIAGEDQMFHVLGAVGKIEKAVNTLAGKKSNPATRKPKPSRRAA